MAQRDIPTSDEMRDKYPSNSYSRDTDSEPTEEKQIRQVAQGKAHKQGLLQRLGRYLIEDTIENAKEKAFSEIVAPGIKTLIFDTGVEILSVILFKESSAGGYRPRSGGPAKRGDRTSYRDYYDRKDKGHRRDTRDIPFDPDDIIVDTRAEAHMVLDELDHIIHKYGQASVADFYDIVGVTSDWTDNRYGWTDIRNASIRPVREGFMLVMPRTHVLED